MAIKVYVDQAHNPVNPNAGAEGFGLREQDIVYKIGIELADILQNDPNFEVMLSRPTPETQKGTSITSSLSSRVNEANAWGADYFLSLHTNASTIPEANGSEAYVYSAQSSAYTLAQYLLTGITDASGFRNKGVFVRPSLYVLRRTAMPAVLLELGYISNFYEANFMNDNPRLFAQGIYNGLRAYLGLS